MTTAPVVPRYVAGPNAKGNAAVHDTVAGHVAVEWDSQCFERARRVAERMNQAGGEWRVIK